MQTLLWKQSSLSSETNQAKTLVTLTLRLTDWQTYCRLVCDRPVSTATLRWL